MNGNNFPLSKAKHVKKKKKKSRKRERAMHTRNPNCTLMKLLGTVMKTKTMPLHLVTAAKLQIIYYFCFVFPKRQKVYGQKSQ